MNELALLGGKPVRTELFPAYKVIGEEEKSAVNAVMDTGILSRYIGAHHPDFMGGEQVRAFEAAWAKTFQARNAISVNSATSGLYAAAGAIGIGPGDEVIVPPYTMMASVTAVIAFNAVPVFADIDARTFCMDPQSIRHRITSRTKAIIVVHLFGQIADMDGIMEIAREFDLAVIEDCAQAPFATQNGQQAGTIGHIGVFSLNYHKHIHTGEGGVVVTNDDDLAERVCLIRNHAEAVAGRKGITNIVNLVGFNFRMGEIEAAIALSQLSKGPGLIKSRQENVKFLEGQISNVPGLRMPYVSEGNEHVYYVHTLTYDATVTDVSRAVFVNAVKAELPSTKLREGEGALMGAGYVQPIYLEPMFQQQIAYGKQGCPFACPLYEGETNYQQGLCPNVELAHFETVITHEMIRPPMTEADLRDVANAFYKVTENISILRDWEHKQEG